MYISHSLKKILVSNLIHIRFSLIGILLYIMYILWLILDILYNSSCTIRANYPQLSNHFLAHMSMNNHHLIINYHHHIILHVINNHYHILSLYIYYLWHLTHIHLYMWSNDWYCYIHMSYILLYISSISLSLGTSILEYYIHIHLILLSMIHYILFLW
jgi:hypothetical protein